MIFEPENIEYAAVGPGISKQRNATIKRLASKPITSPYKIKPCPKCGAEPYLKRHASKVSYAVVVCPKCGRRGNVIPQDPANPAPANIKAVNAWNAGQTITDQLKKVSK